MEPAITLYQFTLCPFCNKVRAALELKGLEYTIVEVSPRSKVELPDLPAEAPRKVPVLRVGEQVLYDSTTILMALDSLFPSSHALLPKDPTALKEAERIEDWVDAHFIRALPTVIYGTWAASARAAKTISRASKFTLFQGFGVKVGGPVIMRLVAGRILKREGRSDGKAWVLECLAEFEEWLGDNAYVGGPQCSIADAAMQGAISCVQDFPIFEEIMARPRISAWYGRMEQARSHTL
jgi:microsomal prostaglandin-E synthase 2